MLQTYYMPNTVPTDFAFFFLKTGRALCHVVQAAFKVVVVETASTSSVLVLETFTTIPTFSFNLYVCVRVFFEVESHYVDRLQNSL